MTHIPVRTPPRCHFCGEPTSAVNYRRLRQQTYLRSHNSTIEIRRGDREILVHSICGLPESLDTHLEVEACMVNARTEEPREIIYVDVGDLPHEEARQYVEFVAKNCLAKQGSVFVQAVRGR